MRTRLKRLATWDRFSPAFYWVSTSGVRLLLVLLVRWRVMGRERVPRTGGFILASNHLNNADPGILGAAIARRRIRFMAKVELFRYPFGVIPRLYGAFPVRRFESDARALLQAERLLRDGQVIGMFPEGTRSRTGYLGSPHPGTGIVALRSGAPVLPCAVTGTEILRNPLRLVFRPRFTVTIGEPLVFEPVRRPNETQVRDATDRIFSAIAAMLPPKYLPPYTGDRDDVAGSEQSDAGGDPPGQ